MGQSRLHRGLQACGRATVGGGAERGWVGRVALERGRRAMLLRVLSLGAPLRPYRLLGRKSRCGLIAAPGCSREPGGVHALRPQLQQAQRRASGRRTFCLQAAASKQVHVAQRSGSAQLQRGQAPAVDAPQLLQAPALHKAGEGGG